MEALWNKIDLNRPPTGCWRPVQGGFDTSNFISATNKVLRDLTTQDILRTEAAILSRLIYRMKSKFRSDKGLKNMEKVNRALLNYLHLSLEKEYYYLRDNTIINKNETSLPTRQMLEYVLIRTQGFARLMCRLEQVAKCSAEFFKTRLNLGQAWMMSVMAYSIISRIWMISRYLVKRCCVWYNYMYPYLEKLKIVGIKWISDDQTLPLDLKCWLDIPWIDEEIKCPLADSMSNSIFSLIKTQNDSEEEDSLFDIEKKLEKKEITFSRLEPQETAQSSNQLTRNDLRYLKTKKDMTEILTLTGMSELGEKISRQSFNSQLDLNKPAQSSKERKINDAKNMTTKVVLSQLSTSAPISDIGEKISRESFNSRLEPEIPAPPLKKRKINDRKKMKKRDDSSESSAIDCISDTSEKISRESFDSRPDPEQPAKSLKKKKMNDLKNIKTKEDLKQLLNLDIYPGLDKLQWNMLKKRLNKTLVKLEKHPSNGAKHKLLIDKMIQSIRESVN